MVKTIAVAALVLGVATPAGAQALKRPVSDVQSAAEPVAAQDYFPAIDVIRITGARVEQQEILEQPAGGIDDAAAALVQQDQVLRPSRTCSLDAMTAQRVATILKRARPSPEQWESLGADTVIRFSGAGAQLIAVISSVRSNGPYAETRIFLAGKAAYLNPKDKSAADEILGGVGCPFYVPGKES